MRKDELEMAKPEQGTPIPAPADTPRVLTDLVKLLLNCLHHFEGAVGIWEGEKGLRQEYDICFLEEEGRGGWKLQSSPNYSLNPEYGGFSGK